MKIKSINNFIKENIFATPANTIGMENPSTSTNISDGSGDTLMPLITYIKKKKKLKKEKII